MPADAARHAVPPAPYLAAAIQFEPELFAVERNIGELERLTIAAAEHGAKLIVHPEMATTGYCIATPAEIAPFAEPIPGPTTERFAAIAAHFGCWIVIGLPEVFPPTGVLYNSSVLIGPQGVAGLYRKTHSFISEPMWAKDGDLGIPVFDTPLGRLAMTICMDLAYPEAARVPALLGADVICFPTNWLLEKAPAPSWQARALENGVYVVAANRYGLERGVQFDGGSCVIGPDGRVLAEQDTGDGIVLAEIDVARARDKRRGAEGGEHLVADRRPELYDRLTRNTYLFNPAAFHGLYGLGGLPAGRASRIAVGQFAPIPGDLDENLAQMDEQAAALAGADLIVFPELALTGEMFDRTQAERAAESLPGAGVAALQDLARARRTTIVAGLVERGADGALYNAAVVVGASGLLAVARKAHLTARDRAWATPGDIGLTRIDLPFARLGVLIGYDALFPEAARALALDGCDLLACPALVDWPGPLAQGPTAIPFPPFVETGFDEDHFHLWRERGFENNTAVAFANGAAPYLGWSGVFVAQPEGEPRREALIREGEAGVAAETLDTTSLHPSYQTTPIRAKDMCRMRQPIWYDLLQAGDLEAAVPPWARQGWGGES